MSSWAFEAEIFSWAGDQPGSWRFVRVPDDVSDELRMEERGGWGSLKVAAAIGATTWETSVFPERAASAFLLPVKKAVRVAEGIDDGDVVAVRLHTAPRRRL